jgi:hypothetical protein
MTNRWEVTRGASDETQKELRNQLWIIDPDTREMIVSTGIFKDEFGGEFTVGIYDEKDADLIASAPDLLRDLAALREQNAALVGAAHALIDAQPGSDAQWRAMRVLMAAVVAAEKSEAPHA